MNNRGRFRDRSGMIGGILLPTTSCLVRISRFAATLSRSQGRSSRAGRNCRRSDRSGRPGIVSHFRVPSRDWRRSKTGRRDWWLGRFRPAPACGGGDLRSKSAVFHTIMIVAHRRRREPPYVGVIDVRCLFSPFGLAGVYANKVGLKLARKRIECLLEAGQIWNNFPFSP